VLGATILIGFEGHGLSPRHRPPRRRFAAIRNPRRIHAPRIAMPCFLVDLGAGLLHHVAHFTTSVFDERL